MANTEPVVCTLTQTQLQERRGTWKVVLARAARGYRLLPNGVVVTLVNDTKLLAELRELIRAERECCRWMNLELHEDGSTLLTITGDSDAGIDAIKAFAVTIESR